MAPKQQGAANQVAIELQLPHAPTDPLEQRILDLLYPFREECFTDTVSPFTEQERKALILCENIAFLIRHSQSSYGKKTEPNDISIASRNWQGMLKGTGLAGVGIFVNGNGYTHTVVRTNVQPGENLVDVLTLVVDQCLLSFFPGT